MIRSALALAVVCLVTGCPPSGAPAPIPPGPGPGTGYQSGAPLGGACDDGSDCASGLCEGQGCGAAGGRCADPGRVCTADAVEYCGCDGVTFTGSSGCPGGRYEKAGACEPATTGLPDGAACLDGAACASGTCEGLGCGDAAPGVCMTKQRPCTMDLRQYCGCDGVTFNGSGTCPGRRYAAKGACAVSSAPKPAGSACLVATDCESGACEGLGCGADTPGICADVKRRCTRDARAYCGCDGKTFRASGTCPGQRYSAKAACGSAP